MNPAIASMLNEEVRAKCASCKKTAYLAFDERMSHRWTCYGCGRMHFRTDYDRSLTKRKSSK